jgi:hypothetical protein
MSTKERIEELENVVDQIQGHLYGPVSDDIERLHQCVDMWADVSLNTRVEALDITVKSLIKMLGKKKRAKYIQKLVEVLEGDAFDE